MFAQTCLFENSGSLWYLSDVSFCVVNTGEIMALGITTLLSPLPMGAIAFMRLKK